MTVLYYWYYHGIPDKMQDIINAALEEKNYNDFMFYYELLYRKFKGNNGYLTFLPKEAYVFEGDDIIGTLDITQEDNFKKIDGFDSEFG